ncbi:MAG: hypothetical protein AAF512_05465 [Pseudomonadota bacterium]
MNWLLTDYSDDPTYLRMLLREGEIWMEPDVGGRLNPIPQIKS